MSLRRKVGITLKIGFFVFYFFIIDGNAQSISSSELISGAKLYDGKLVVYRGEVIGDIMARGVFAWVNVNDGQAALGIWLENKLSKGIFYTGSYKTIGDVLEIEGVFNRSCPEHGGDLDIHAKTLRKIKNGRDVLEKADVLKMNLVFILSGGICLVWILSRLKRR